MILIFFFFIKAGSKGLVFPISLLPANPPPRAFPSVSFLSAPHGKLTARLYRVVKALVDLEWGSVRLHPKISSWPRAQKPSPHPTGQVLMSPPVLIPGHLWWRRVTGILTFLLEESVLLCVWSRCLAHLILWYERMSQPPCRLIYSWCFHKEQNVACGSTMASPRIRSFTEQTVNCTPWSFPLGGRRGLLVLCSNKSSQEWIWTFRRCEVWLVFK